MTRLGKLGVSLSGCFLVAFLGSAITIPSITTWYTTLNKPFFNPPNFIFGPVWTVLYLLMGVAFYLIWSNHTLKKIQPAVNIFVLQLFLNFLWSFLFFYLHQPLLALIEIVFLALAIFSTIKEFNKYSKLAGKLLVPYLAWVCFASILNLFIVILN